jgi:hypothetical protein
MPVSQFLPSLMCFSLIICSWTFVDPLRGSRSSQRNTDPWSASSKSCIDSVHIYTKCSVITCVSIGHWGDWTLSIYVLITMLLDARSAFQTFCICSSSFIFASSPKISVIITPYSYSINRSRWSGAILNSCDASLWLSSLTSTFIISRSIKFNTAPICLVNLFSLLLVCGSFSSIVSPLSSSRTLLIFASVHPVHWWPTITSVARSLAC